MRALVLVAALLTSPACSVEGTFECRADEQCAAYGKIGQCQLSGFCSFEDAACGSHQRYDPSAGSLADQCVDDIVAGRFRHLYATNDAAFSPIVEEAVPAASAITFVVILDDGSTATVKYNATDGTFRFPIKTPGQTYLLAVSFGGEKKTFFHNAPFLELAETSAGRPDRGLVTLPTTVRFQYSGTLSGTTVISSTGLWTETNTGSGQNTFTFTYSNATSLSGPRGLLEAAKNDRLYFTRQSSTNGFTTITVAAAIPVTLTDGAAITLAPQLLVPTPPDQCRRMIVRHAEELARIKAALPLNYPQAVGNLGIGALPSLDPLIVQGSLSLAGQQSTGNNLPNIDFMARYLNPYTGSRPIATSLVSAQFDLSMQGLPGPRVANATRTTVPITGTGSCPDVTLAPTVGIFGPLSVGGTMIDTNDKRVTIDRTKPVVLAWMPAAPGVAHMHSFQLHELTNDGLSTQISAALLDITTVGPSIALDADLLASGKTYVLHLFQSTGFPRAAMGDYVASEPPYDQSQTWSKSFTVQ